MITLVPAILSENLSDYIEFTKKYSHFAETIHLDVMDGKYVQAKSPDVLEILKALEELSDSDKLKNIPEFSIHLMTENPTQELKIISEFSSETTLWLNKVYVHIEKISEDELNKFKDLQISLTINPELKVEDFIDLIKTVHSIQIMTVIPGFQGGEFIKESLEKITELRKLGYSGEIHLDGDINAETIPQVIKYSPQVLNAGSAIQKAKTPALAYRDLNTFLEESLNS